MGSVKKSLSVRWNCLKSIRALSFMAILEKGGRKRGELKNVQWVRGIAEKVACCTLENNVVHMNHYKRTNIKAYSKAA